MSCPICSGSMEQVFQAQVLSKYEASYQMCASCGYLMAKDPHWLKEAYSDAIAQADTGLVMRNITTATKLAGIIYFALKLKGDSPCLDVAGGYGVLTRLMRDFGFNFYWADVYCKNMIAPGFEYSDAIGSCDVITAMEVMEHLEDPVDFVRTQIANSHAKYFVFTTELFEGAPPIPSSWWYYSFETGQHIGFFQKKTLAEIAKRLGMHFSSAGGVHIFSHTPINHAVLKVVSNKFLAPLIAMVVRKLTGSKTMSDHLKMLNNIELRD